MKRHFNLLASVLLVIAMVFAFASCDVISQYIPGINQPEPEHQHAFVDGSCECGEADPNYVAPHEHNFVEGKCECGETDPNYVAPHEHNFVEGKCECGETDPNYVPPHEHSYEAAVTAPTCTDAGYTTYTCACGDSYNADEVKALGHTFIDSKCTKCDAEYVAPAAGDWALVTELKTGDHVLIGAPAYGKLLSATKTGYYNIGVDYAADNFANVTDAEIWVVTKNDDGTYSFVSATGDILALSTYASLNVEGQHKTWTVESAGADTFYIKNVGRGNYLEWYAEKNNWSTYATSSLSDLFEMSFYAKGEAEGEHVHNHISDAHENTCTEDGYTSYTCKCGDTYSVAGDAATGHAYTETVVAPTCTDAGYTAHICGNCGDSYNTDETAALGHSFAEGKCTVCGAEDPDYHVHNYVDVITTPATCTATGVMTPTCSCGDTKEPVELEMIPHVDENLDITCDYEGCTKRILPAADSKVSLFTANHMIIVSLSSNYYVEGVITEITDAKNGIFIIEDAEGYSVLIRLPKNADGTAYSAGWSFKLCVGDTVQVYGKPTRNTSTPTTETTKVESGVLTVLQHTHNFSEATCDEASNCACGSVNGEALGHVDENKDNICDRCPWKMNMAVSDIVVATDPTIANGVITNGDDDKALYWTWGNDDFDVVIHKGTSTYTVYTTAKAYMQLKKANTLTVNSKNGLVMKEITIRVSNATQLGYLKTAIGTAYTFTENADALSLTIAYDSAEAFSFANVGSSTVYVSGVEIVYEKPIVKAEPVTVVMANTITDTQTSYMTGGNDAALVGLDPSIFTVTGDKGNMANNVALYYKSTLNVPSQIRLSSSTGTGHSITVSAADGYKITSIKITFTTTANHRGYVVTDADGTTLYSVATDATFDSVDAATAIVDVNGSSFTITNAFTVANKPVWIAAIEITYEEV